jgi:hypothetical protein
MAQFDYRIIPEEKHEHLNILFSHAINLLECRIRIMKEQKSNYSSLIDDLDKGLENLKVGQYNFQTERGKRILFKKPPQKRGGLGLSRGFGEVLGNIREPWVEELMDSIYTIERYYRNM